jgi:hypothetical protein
MAPQFQYDILTGDPFNVKTKLNELAAAGWEPLMMTSEEENVKVLIRVALRPKPVLPTTGSGQRP